MIASKLPPWWSCIATAIHTKSFNCFVSTAKHLFVRRWSTRIFRGDPAVDTNCRTVCQVVYRKGLTRQEIYLLHDELSEGINLMGENGVTLPDAVESVLAEFERGGFIESPTG
jgi:hypothetical protein